MVYLVVAYLAWCLVLFGLQRTMMFPTGMLGPPGDGPWRDDAVELVRDIGDRRQVVAWFFPAPAGGAAGAGGDRLPGWVVYCHGNGELMDGQRRVVDAYRAMGLSTLVLEYRGYGHSDGRPSERALVDDGMHFIDQVVARGLGDPEMMVLHGRSVGGAVAAQLAARRGPKLLITESTFTHTGAFAWRYGVPPLLVRDRFDTRAVLPTLDCPVLLFHGEADRIIPPSHSRRLEALTPGARLVTYPGVGHNDFPGWGNETAFWEEVREAVAGEGTRGSRD